MIHRRALLAAVTVGTALLGLSHAVRSPVPSDQAATGATVPVTDSTSPPEGKVRSSAGSPKAETTPEGRVLYAPVPDAHGKVQARVPELEEALDVEDPDDARTRDVRERASASIPPEAQLQELDVRCSTSFCRIRMVKPSAATVAWQRIDQALLPVAAGEAMFLTEEDGDLTTAYLYFADPEGHLPLGSPEDAEQEGS